MVYMQTVFFVLSFLVITYLYIDLKKTKHEVVRKDSPLLTYEGLLKHASEISQRHETVKGHNSIASLLSRMDENYRYIANVYRKFNSYLNKKIYIPNSSEWILDNFYIFERQTKELRLTVQRKYFKHLPLIKAGVYRDYPRVFAIAYELVSHTDSIVEQQVLIDFISEYQRTLKLSDAEIWSLETMIRIALIENIRILCEKLMFTQQQYEKANETLVLLWKFRDNKKELQEIINEKFRFFRMEQSSFFEYLVKSLRKKGIESRIILACIEHRLSELNILAEDIIRIEHQKQATRHVSIGNAITSLRFMLNLNFTEVFESLSIVEQVLNMDPSGIYPKMDKATKNYYRQKVEEIAKKFNLSEIEVAKRSIRLAKEYEGINNKKRHVGYYLLETNLGMDIKGKLQFKQCIYILFSLFASSVGAGLLYSYMYNQTFNLTGSCLVFVFSFFVISDVVLNILNYALTRRTKIKMIPKLDFKNGIPDYSKTLVVISTILSSQQDVKDLAEKIEVYRYANSDKNLYFGILSDFADSDVEKNEAETAILSAMEREITALNKKYGHFYLFHRNRIFDSRAKKYMGWERKRGALIELNRLIKRNNTTNFGSIIGDRYPLREIKYIITLDSDTRLTIDSANRLVAAMSHTLNQPEIENNVVISGYGLLQPRILIDIHYANKSWFSKIFAGQGGIDAYSHTVSDVYQDLFGEGIYTGKGIYDIDVFDKILDKLIPQNTVLSHDLLEGCWVRCGLVSDVKFIDGFPWRYNAYSMRQHRWTRGDWQIIRWLFFKFKNSNGSYVKNSLNLISKWKIFDNLRRSLSSICTLGLIFTSFVFFSSINVVCLLAFSSICSSLLISTVDWFFNKGYKYSGQRFHSTIIYGFAGVVYQIVLIILFLPHQAALSMDAILRSLWRMCISKKKLLEWVTAQNTNKKLKNTLFGFYEFMIFNLFACACLLVPKVGILAWWLAGFWFLAPLIAYLISKPDIKKVHPIPQNYREELEDLAKRMWAYFDNFASSADNFLPPDNYQENPHNGIAHRTSPTNIGIFLVSCLSAKDFGFVSLETMLSKIENTIEVIKKLDKWNGHLYNWYNTQTLETMRPRYVSTVDNGNFIVYLITLKQGLISFLSHDVKINDRIYKIVKFIEETIVSTKFSLLYDEKRKLFSIGYNIEEDKLTKSYYDLLASEARQTSYIAIAMGEVSKDHWHELARTLTTSNKFRGLVSWTGTMFEYLMPLLVMKNVPNTLLDETYKFVVYCQKKYGAQREVPWGTSESGFNLFDMDLNYQYKAFGVPELGLKRDLGVDMVVAPYASVMALMVDSPAAMKNIKKLKDMGLIGQYGFYEAADYTPKRIPYKKTYGIVQSYMSHHIGMSLLAIDNFLNDNIMQQRFHSDINIKSTEELLEERIPTRVVITEDNKQELRPLEQVEQQDYDAVRVIDNLDKLNLDEPMVHVLSNGKFSSVMTDSGTGWCGCRGYMLSRFRKDIIGIYGSFVYIKNLDTQKLWSNKYAPLYVEPDEYRVIFKPYAAEYFRKDGDVETHTEIMVSSEHNAEITTISIVNRGNEDINLEITSYVETTLVNYQDDLAHMAFSNLFIETEFNESSSAIISRRRPRKSGNKAKWSVHSVWAETFSGSLEFETDRAKFIGRNNSVLNPNAMHEKLSGTQGAVLDPCASLRVQLNIKAGETSKIVFVNGSGETFKDVIEISEAYRTQTSLARYFEMAQLRARSENKYLGLSSVEQELYLKILTYIIFPIRQKVQERYIIQNISGQERLWNFSISGDNPIVTIVADESNFDIVSELINAHTFWKIKGIKTDLVILANDSGYMQPIYQTVSEIISVSHASDQLGQNGGVFLIPLKVLSDVDKNLLFAVSSILINENIKDINREVKAYERTLSLSLKQFEDVSMSYQWNNEEINKMFDTNELEFFNGYGGFKNNEYHIHLDNNNSTPMPWSNIISNEQFGFIATESGGGHIWAENSRENKLTPWYNDSICDYLSEIFYVLDNNTGRVFSPTKGAVMTEAQYLVTHGFGYTKYVSIADGLHLSMTVFVPKSDNVKLAILEITNLTDKVRNLSVIHYVRPVMGVTDEQTAPFISSKLHEKGIILFKNHFNREFPDRIMFVGYSKKIDRFTTDRIEFYGGRRGKSIPMGVFAKNLSGITGAAFDICSACAIDLILDSGQTENLIAIVGQGETENDVVQIYEKYKIEDFTAKSLMNVRDYWSDIIGQVTVSTPDKSFDFVLNGWLLYQAISCRIMGRSAFYQSGGAYGFRDQLQDVIAILHTDPKMARKQIILHSKHQFVQGDVQHWWHPSGLEDSVSKGTRTKFSDDLLWLPYATAEYVKVTGDYSILDEFTLFLETEELPENVSEYYVIPRKSDQGGTIYEHCVRSIERAIKFGQHGLPLMGSGDWNDGMDTVGHKGKGESVWMGWFLSRILTDFSQVCQRRGDDERAKRYCQICTDIMEGIESNAWDGEWYVRAFFDDGIALGSKTNVECKIDAIAQAWSVIAGGNRDRSLQAMASLENNLIDREIGIIKLLTPAFDSGNLNPGYIKGYVPGIRENGGQYTHAAAWVIMAFAKLGMSDKAVELFNMINPINHSRNKNDALLYKAEPYVISADVYSNMIHLGRGGWSWYTGAAAWFYRVGLEYILGIKKIGNTLSIDPGIPSNWEKFNVIYKFNGTIYNITVKNFNAKNTLSTPKIIELVDDNQEKFIDIELDT